MDNDTFTIIFGIVVLIFAILFFVKMTMRIRKYGGSLATTMHAATYEFLSKDMQEAVKEVVEMTANKKNGRIFFWRIYKGRIFE